MFAREGIFYGHDAEPSSNNRMPHRISSSEPPSFTYVNIHGRWQGPEGTTPITNILKNLGHTVINPRLARPGPSGNIVNLAEIVVDAIKEHDNLVFNAHSFGNKVLAHVLQKIDPDKVVAANMLADPGPDDFITPGVERYVAGYKETCVKELGNGTSLPYPAIQPDVFYPDIKDKNFLEEIVAGNTPWPTQDDKLPTPALPSQKVIPLFSIRGLQDRRIHTLARVMEVDKNWIKMSENPISPKVRWLNGGHTLWASMPQRLAYVLSENAQLSYVYRHKPRL